MTTRGIIPHLENELLPVEIVLHPSWWHRHEGINFDEDFFFHPRKRVEAERQMENALHERWGTYGLGRDHDSDVPHIGAVHLATGYLVSEMLGCEVIYQADSAPQVICRNLEELTVDVDAAFRSRVYKKTEGMIDRLKDRFGYVTGDINWSGILNVALDLRGQNLFMDMVDRPEEVKLFFSRISQVIERFTVEIQRQTGTTSVSVNRNLVHFRKPVFLHSECSLVMISVEDYERMIMPFDVEWSHTRRPFGIHYCGNDAHRYAATFGKIGHLDFLDLGYGGDVRELREHLPDTFFNLRLSPVEITGQSNGQIRTEITRLVQASKNPWLTGVCCINMDNNVGDEKISEIFETVNSLRALYAKGTDVGSIEYKG